MTPPNPTPAASLSSADLDRIERALPDRELILAHDGFGNTMDTASVRALLVIARAATRTPANEAAIQNAIRRAEAAEAKLAKAAICGSHTWTQQEHCPVCDANRSADVAATANHQAVRYMKELAAARTATREALQRLRETFQHWITARDITHGTMPAHVAHRVQALKDALHCVDTELARLNDAPQPAVPEAVQTEREAKLNKVHPREVSVENLPEHLREFATRQQAPPASDAARRIIACRAAPGQCVSICGTDYGPTCMNPKCYEAPPASDAARPDLSKLMRDVSVEDDTHGDWADAVESLLRAIVERLSRTGPGDAMTNSTEADKLRRLKDAIVTSHTDHMRWDFYDGNGKLSDDATEVVRLIDTLLAEPPAPSSSPVQQPDAARPDWNEMMNAVVRVDAEKVPLPVLRLLRAIVERLSRTGEHQ